MLINHGKKLVARCGQIVQRFHSQAFIVGYPQNTIDLSRDNSSFQDLGEDEHIVVDCVVFQPQIGDRSTGVEYGRVISAAESLSDCRQAGEGEFLGQPHRNLARACNLAGAFL